MLDCELPNAFSLARAGRWFLDSGIQEDSGGVARYYDVLRKQNRSISTEITGYAASTYIYLYRITGDERYLNRATHTARFLAGTVWPGGLGSFPFEYPSPSQDCEHHAYFFDTGIIIRGLLAVWRCTKEYFLLDVAKAAAQNMGDAFDSGKDYHPVIALPDKTPFDRDQRWSRSAGCYQLKAAVAWWEVAEITGDDVLRERYLALLEASLSTHEAFLPGTEDTHRIMDRLHAYLYFLEGLCVAMTGREDCAVAYRRGLTAVSAYLNELAPSFLRADVCAQLLRARINGELLEALPVDLTAAAREAELLASFQMSDSDIRVDGSVAFGRRDGQLIPHMNPWATGFAIQAIAMWEQFRAGQLQPCPELLI